MYLGAPGHHSGGPADERQVRLGVVLEAMPSVLRCPSCGRTKTGPDAVQTIIDTYGVEWCAKCAAVGTTSSGSTFVNRPSPGCMGESSPDDVLAAWQDCYSMQPKKRILVEAAKRELQQSWDSWAGASRSEQQMFLFFLWAQRHRPYFLTFRCKSDRWQRVHSWLLEHERKRGAG